LKTQEGNMTNVAQSLVGSVIGCIMLLATAQAAERPFYQGKNITFLINFAAGGPALAVRR